MQLTGWARTFYSVSDWLMRLAYVNILWIVFTMVGLVIFGFFPATTAMFAIIRKWVMGEQEFPVFKTFWKYYKSEFKKVNLLGLVLVVIGSILYIDLQIFPSGDNLLFLVVRVGLIILSIFFLVMLMYFFPVYVHFDFPFSQYLKYPIMMSIIAPLQTVLLLVSTYLIYLIMVSIPGLILFFGVSTFSFVWSWIILNFIKKVEQKNQNNQKNLSNTGG
ncbi:YesL family protein [Lentibacillus sediminis]|uniref:YesL family protein n=1 Tax=Lentibacillus sediminis TaxID=1940529 RepID=UPI000C1BB956|nr:YesL family protein [Lentibacillus sediminis]